MGKPHADGGIMSVLLYKRQVSFYFSLHPVCFRLYLVRCYFECFICLVPFILPSELCGGECQNNGVCVQENFCQCRGGHSGDHCEIKRKIFSQGNLITTKMPLRVFF